LEFDSNIFASGLALRPGQGEEIGEEEAMAWENIKVGIMILEEEDGEWIVKEDDTRLLNTNPTNQIILKSTRGGRGARS
jgi:hypothetical protein